MIFSSELLEKARTASSAEELLKMAKDYGIELSPEDAESYFGFLKKTDIPLSDEELDQVTGGKGEKTPEPKYKAGTSLWVGYVSTRNYLGIVVRHPEFYDKTDGWRYYCTNEYNFDQNYYLETWPYVHTFKPKEWID